MANQSFGFVTVTSAGTPVRCTANETDPTANMDVHSYLIEVKPTNTGNIYVGTSVMNKTTGTGVFAILPPPTSTMYPSFSASIVEAAASFDLSNIYLDADNSGEKALVTAIIA